VIGVKVEGLRILSGVEYAHQRGLADAPINRGIDFILHSILSAHAIDEEVVRLVACRVHYAARCGHVVPEWFVHVAGDPRTLERVRRSTRPRSLAAVLWIHDQRTVQTHLAIDLVVERVVVEIGARIVGGKRVHLAGADGDGRHVGRNALDDEVVAQGMVVVNRDVDGIAFVNRE